MKRDAKGNRVGLAGAERRTSNVERQTLNEAGAAAPVIYDLEERLLQYSARIIRLVDSMPKARGANHVGGQLLRSGTSPLSNHGEAQAAESVEDFIHKLKICKMELIESHRWLRLIHLAPLVRKPERIAPLIDKRINSSASSPRASTPPKPEETIASRKNQPTPKSILG